jgi:hypothetical protein
MQVDAMVAVFAGAVEPVAGAADPVDAHHCAVQVPEVVAVTGQVPQRGRQAGYLRGEQVQCLTHVAVHGGHPAANPSASRL